MYHLSLSIRPSHRANHVPSLSGPLDQRIELIMYHLSLSIRPAHGAYHVPSLSVH